MAFIEVQQGERARKKVQRELRGSGSIRERKQLRRACLRPLDFAAVLLVLSFGFQFSIQAAVWSALVHLPHVMRSHARGERSLLQQCSE